MIERDQPGRVDRLETILEAIAASQQTGICHVERGKGGVRETANIVFLFGEVVEVTLGERGGVDALNRLKTWGSCLYMFTPKSPSEIVVSPPPAPAPSTTSVSTTPLSFISQIIPNINQALPKIISSGEEATKPDESARQDNPARPATTENLQFSPPPLTPVEGVVFQSSPYMYAPSVPDPRTPEPRTPQPNMSEPRTPQPHMLETRTSQPRMPETRTPQPRMPEPPINNPTSPIPYRLVEGSQALAFMERARLSRLHRHIFLLLDGKRSVRDLSRITRHSLADIQRLLADLEYYGLIKQGNAINAFNNQ
ncbi:MAG TPA: hypothetical protein VFB12_25255 [Ktedonobacteraceae bacterium]|nr:hypothetical protein [Ktedonobacteraceae bacterium]